MDMRTAFIVVGLAGSSLAAAVTVPGQPVPGPGASPTVTWDPEASYGGVARPASVRAMTAAELKLSRERATAFFQALQAVPGFARPERHATFLTSWAHLERGPVLSQSFTLFWSAPRDTRRRADGAFFGVMGGAHEILYGQTNHAPGAGLLAENEHNAFHRGIEGDGLPQGFFVQPRVYGQAGGGTVYGGLFIATRDGRSALAPAPLAALLETDIARLQKRVADSERGQANGLRELEASMTPEAVAARRAKREAAWARETRDPAAMAKRLDAAARTDEADYERQKAWRSPPPTPDPRHAHWGPKLALQALEQKLAALDASTRNAPACGSLDAAFAPELAVRWHAAGPDAPGDCRPMVRIREDLLAPGKPEDVRLFTAWLRDANCGRAWDRPAQDHICSRINAALRELDWAAVRRSFGWKEQP